MCCISGVSFYQPQKYAGHTRLVFSCRPSSAPRKRQRMVKFCNFLNEARRGVSDRQRSVSDVCHSVVQLPAVIVRLLGFLWLSVRLVFIRGRVGCQLFRSLCACLSVFLTSERDGMARWLGWLDRMGAHRPLVVENNRNVVFSAAMLRCCLTRVGFSPVLPR